MSTLEERLERIREGFEKKAPAAAKQVMHRATDDLRASGILDRVVKPGDPLPAFELEDTEGQRVRSTDLLDGRPLVMTFYRGVW